jgi:hypothetical protein
MTLNWDSITLTYITQLTILSIILPWRKNTDMNILYLDFWGKFISKESKKAEQKCKVVPLHAMVTLGGEEV